MHEPSSSDAQGSDEMLIRVQFSLDIGSANKTDSLMTYKYVQGDLGQNTPFNNIHTLQFPAYALNIIMGSGLAPFSVSKGYIYFYDTDSSSSSSRDSAIP